ncbi:T9SS type A sorting domain-containing protein [uncultured Dokdonia sp.]|uniref:T9SS type A sorting domain-containing protein n=1 Tax=uncultured Dokdonia sp. TaxID=575653 RepID=UPI0026143CCD|nr:T9SS type A sorting domain-containing protein [uncultured Dokdonia sp.]
MKNNYTFFSLCILLFTSSTLFAQNGFCADIESLCLTNNTVIFPNCFNGDGNCVTAAETGPDYGCLGSTPYPTWQFIEISQAGDLDFQITQNTSFDNNGDPSGNLLDVDFIVWGPFGENDELCDYDNLQSANLVDCSFSTAAVENMSIPNAIAGERYVLVITNFNQNQGFIKIEQTAGDGATVCSTGMETTFEACEGDSIELMASVSNASNYQWFVFDGNDFVTIPDETTAFLNVTQDGVYRVSYTLADNTMVDEDLTAIFNPIPAIVTPSDYIICDDDNDGFATFMLSLKDAEITNGNPDLAVTYHETEADAFADVAPLLDLYTNVTPFLQTIYARAENSETGCFAVVPLNLVVLDSPIIIDTIPNIELEDIDNDGFEVFDLTANEAQIIGAQNPADFVLTYHITLDDALNNTNPIANPSAFTNTQNPQTIFVRLESFANGCFATGDFLLILSSTFTDSDNDGIPDIDEDLNGNGNLDDDDTDSDDIPNYLDEDDDGDTVNTSIEIEGIGAGFAPQDFIDTDNDLIENYLDNDDDGDMILTINEDYNNSGSPLDDDLNNNDIPDFLDPEVALAVSEEAFVDLKLYPNPTHDIVSIRSSSFTQEATATLYSIEGKRIATYTLAISGQMIRMDLSAMATGIYFVNIQSGNQQVTKQLIKK